MLGGLFGAKEQHPNFERITHALQNHLGFATAPPAPEVLAILEQMTPREMLSFDNMHSLQGMQALFKSKSLRANLDPESSTITITIDDGEDTAAGGAPEPRQTPVLNLGEHHAKFHVEPPKALPSVMKMGLAAMKPSEESLAPIPEAFAHLEAFEQLTQHLMDLLLRHGRINTGDKDVLKKIRPSDYTIQGRLSALERWKAELTRRVRGLAVPKAPERVSLGATQPGAAESEESQAKRFETLQIWISKLIKTMEHEGVKFHNKPMWLPH
jgi:hypothetical protein